MRKNSVHRSVLKVGNIVSSHAKAFKAVEYIRAYSGATGNVIDIAVLRDRGVKISGICCGGNGSRYLSFGSSFGSSKEEARDRSESKADRRKRENRRLIYHGESFQIELQIEGVSNPIA